MTLRLAEFLPTSFFKDNFFFFLNKHTCKQTCFTLGFIVCLAPAEVFYKHYLGQPPSLSGTNRNYFFPHLCVEMLARGLASLPQSSQVAELSGCPGRP